eukprot:4757060-Ditylum_brightwellii.AAC.1
MADEQCSRNKRKNGNGDRKGNFKQYKGGQERGKGGKSKNEYNLYQGVADLAPCPKHGDNHTS